MLSNFKTGSSSETRDPGGIGFVEESNGLTLCTEYLGFESYDMRMCDNELENQMTCHHQVESKRRKTKENVVERKFPPPLSSLINGQGQRSFYLRKVRKEGRLELTQVMINRPEILRASRENGRLRLHFVDHDQENMDFEEDNESLSDESVDLDMVKGYDDDDDDKGVSREWSRHDHHPCNHHHHNHHHHGNIHLWSQSYVTTR